MTATHFLVSATEQEIFNKAYLGLKSQGFQKSVNEETICLYRGPNGLKCAIGHCGDDFAEVCIDYAEFWQELGIKRESIDINRKVFLSCLQRAHDLATPNSVKKHMKDFAKSFYLQVPD